jgi:hypothetical protein
MPPIENMPVIFSILIRRPLGNGFSPWPQMTLFLSMLGQPPSPQLSPVSPFQKSLDQKTPISDF